MYICFRPDSRTGHWWDWYILCCLVHRSRNGSTLLLASNDCGQRASQSKAAERQHHIAEGSIKVTQEK